ncbi:MAG: HIT domain-containing protein [Desulfurococcales archaeon]|nr:HIT domain-containing protein [Desulfurococcales archaeon]
MSDWPRPWYRNLWAPWRMTYIKGHDRSGECVFCRAPSLGESVESLIVYRGVNAYVILNKFPYNSGHLMIVPYRHVPSIEDLTMDELSEIGMLVKASLRALRRVYKPHGFNIGVNIGEAAGAGIAEHVHVHVLPRWVGDTNFVTTFAGDKVIPQSLEEAWSSLRPVMREEVERIKGAVEA